MECYESIPQEAREKAKADVKVDEEREADPEYQRLRREYLDAVVQSMMTAHEAGKL